MTNPNRKTVRHAHDRGYKHLLSSKSLFMQLLRSFVRRGWVEHIDEAGMIRVDKSFVLPDFSGKESDLIYRVKIKGKDVIFYILMEFQSTVDALMPWRLLQYQVEIWRHELKDRGQKERNRGDFKLPVIVPIVLYNGSSAWSAPLSFRELLAEEPLFHEEQLLNFSYFLLDIRRYQPEALEKLSNMIGSVFLIEQHSNLSVADLIELFRKLAPVIDNTAQEQREQFALWLEHIMLRFGTVKEQEQMIKKMVSQIQRKGLNAMISNFERNLEWLQQQSIEKGIAQGLEQGKEQGIEQGRARGLEQAAINMLKEGLDLQLVAKVTGLSEHRIKVLKRHLDGKK
ncbi:Rpn family recombination-promoting nuclease/putative transposase [Paenibacillus sp. SYP-B4298]|uniref:Rpn family recombination-promoting nuclease/putative transposase n=1 Tax=Paenibacillus sp. SYP-B4298 TaxID=2996034 RepID=UPI0022DD4486|nr:Rpn family recombination-promoting nuclease/putative transposase [Paenibacillus sp. SYP-B4298]